MGEKKSDPERYHAEAERRWGGTEAWRESTQRAHGWSDADRAEIEAEQETIEVAFAEAMDEGVDATDERAMDLAERARDHIDRRYYECSHRMHSALADMYTSDERFRAHYDDRRPGLAAFVASAIRANASRRRAGTPE